MVAGPTQTRIDVSQYSDLYVIFNLIPTIAEEIEKNEL